MPLYGDDTDIRDFSSWPDPTSRGMAAISLPDVAKRWIPVFGGQDTRFGAATGLSSVAPKVDPFLPTRPVADFRTCPL